MQQPTLNNIDTIIFDLDGTLRYNDPSSDDVFFGIAVELGIPDNQKNRHRAIRWSHYYWAKSTELLLDLMTFDLQKDFFWINYTKRQLLAIDDNPSWADELAPIIQSRMQNEYKPEDRLFHDTHEVLSFFCESDYTVGLVSNRDTPFDDYIDEIGIAGYFDFAFVASQVNSWKPDPQIFQAALERADTTAERSIYIGDNYYADIVGAQNVGIIPILLDRAGAFHDFECLTIRSLIELQDLLPEFSQVR